MSKNTKNKNAKNKNAKNKNRNRNNKRRNKNVLTRREIPWGAIAFFTVIGLVSVVAIGYAFLQTRVSADGSSIAGLVTKENLSRGHVAGAVRYETDPPMGGDHNPVWQNCDGRVYDSPLPNENVVHSLEHGAVWITYRPDLETAQVEALATKVSGTDYTLLSPYPSQDAPITLTAWGNQLKLDDAADARIDRFLRAFVKGPQTPEPGAPCDGARDMP